MAPWFKSLCAETPGTELMTTILSWDVPAKESRYRAPVSPSDGGQDSSHQPEPSGSDSTLERSQTSHKVISETIFKVNFNSRALKLIINSFQEPRNKNKGISQK